MEVKLVGAALSNAARNAYARTSGSIYYGPPPVAEPLHKPRASTHATCIYLSRAHLHKPRAST
jgi:hypothetical protein